MANIDTNLLMSPTASEPELQQYQYVPLSKKVRGVELKTKSSQ